MINNGEMPVQFYTLYDKEKQENHCDKTIHKKYG
jgi:hypothetical protein